jgi:putative iron-only hydrogenase system regulator
MDKSVGVVAIIISDVTAIEKVNTILSSFRDSIIGRMGIPHHNGLNIISIAVEDTKEVINSLSGKLGMLKGVSSKVLLAK